jgi:hypothetical protein
MTTVPPSRYRNQVLEELDRIPQEHLPALANLVRAFRESFALPNAEESFRQGWHEAKRGETRPISELWDGIDAE